jgi:hypothetical protein
MNECAFRRLRCQNKSDAHLMAATIRPNGWLLIVAPMFGRQAPCLLFKVFPGT